MKTWAAAAAMLALAGTAQAGLLVLGDGTVKDTRTNLIWLQDWKTKIYGRYDIAGWALTKAWAEGLTFAGSSDWILPSITDYGTLFKEVVDLTQVSAFTNVVGNNGYWSGTESAFNPINAHTLTPAYGHLYAVNKNNNYRAMAVRVAAVPEPQTCAMLLLGLGAVLLSAKRRPV